MERFYCPELSESSEAVMLSAEESRHARQAFRKSAGDSVELTAGNGLLATATLLDTKPRQISCKIAEIRKVPPPPDRQIHLALSTIRPNRMDWAVEKLTELGIGSIQPLYCQYTSVKAFKTEHLRKIAISALKQSGQAYLPELRPPLPFEDFLRRLNPGETSRRLIAHLTDDAKPFREIGLPAGIPVIILIGPEGGFSGAEVESAGASGFISLKLAHEILRSETAAVVAAAQAKVHLL